MLCSTIFVFILKTQIHIYKSFKLELRGSEKYELSIKKMKNNLGPSLTKADGGEIHPFWRALYLELLDIHRVWLSHQNNTEDYFLGF